MSEQNPPSSGATKPKILVFLGCYLPGFNSGGPVRTLSCMVEALAPYFDFRLVTLNHDSGSKDIYTSVRTGDWNPIGSGQVYYIATWSPSVIERMVREERPDALYLNGFFSTSSVYALVARRARKLPPVAVVLATRGDLAAGALGMKSLKKRAYMKTAQVAGIYSGLLWHASSEREKTEMLRALETFGVSAEMIHVAPDLGFGYDVQEIQKPEKSAGTARFVTLSRIVRMKNPLFTLDQLAALRGEVCLDIFGPLEDRELWKECEQKIAALPPNLNVRFAGPLEPGRVLGELSQRHFFILPTLGENYGHAIIEGAAAGCPVVISDRTQWLGLEEQGVGWDISLDDGPRWQKVLQACVDMPQQEYMAISRKAGEFGRSVMNSKSNLEANVELFRRALGSAGVAPRETMPAGVSQ
ncbi:MAG: glycosyltransferase family 4 protein [Acidobacteriaceae bacterium]